MTHTRKVTKKNRFSCVMNRMEVVVFFLLNSICRLAFDGSADIDMVVLKQWTAESGLVVFENNHTATRACFGVSRFHTCQSQATKYIYIDFFFFRLLRTDVLMWLVTLSYLDASPDKMSEQFVWIIDWSLERVFVTNTIDTHILARRNTFTHRIVSHKMY